MPLASTTDMSSTTNAADLPWIESRRTIRRTICLPFCTSRQQTVAIRRVPIASCPRPARLRRPARPQIRKLTVHRASVGSLHHAVCDATRINTQQRPLSHQFSHPLRHPSRRPVCCARPNVDCYCRSTVTGRSTRIRTSRNLLWGNRRITTPGESEAQHNPTTEKLPT